MILFFEPYPKLLDTTSFSTAIYDSNQNLLRLTLSDDDKYRLFVPIDQIPSTLIEATLLQEDRYFYQHLGVNPFTFIHAVWQTYVVHSRRLGASTITMQLARLRFHIHSKRIAGKLLQIIRAIQLEMLYSKSQILEAYLNLAPYGGNIEGAGAASLIYFHKPLRDAALSELLTLTVIPQNPNSRRLNTAILKISRDRLYQRWIATQPHDKIHWPLMQLPLAMYSSNNIPFLAPHFVNSILEKNQKKRVIKTTLDAHLQQKMEQITKQYVQRKQNLGIYNAAVLLVDTHDLSIKSLVGSADFFNASIQGQINGAEIKRSPGSTLKPFVYGLALDQGLIHPHTILKDVPHSFGSYNPENFDYDFMGPIKAQDALLLSRNIPAIYLASQLNPQFNLYSLLMNASISHLRSERFYGLALALGGVEVSMKELVSLYAMLVNEGVWKPLRDQQNEPITEDRRLLSPEASYLTLEMLQDTAHPSTKNQFIAWKTGTSSGYHDAWTVGVFDHYVLAVWIGNFNNQSNPAFIGKNQAAPLFLQLASAINLNKKAYTPLINHQIYGLNLKKISTCKASGMLPTRYCPETEMTWFIPGKSPITQDTIFREVAINQENGLRTCHYDETTQFIVYEFWPSDILKIFKQAGINRPIPPFYEANCALTDAFSIKPKITSPNSQLNYILSANEAHARSIPLQAVTDGSVNHVYWFINEKFLGKTVPNKPFLWDAVAGNFIVRVIDDHGQSDALDIHVKLSS